MCNQVFHSVHSDAGTSPSHDSQKLTNRARQRNRFSNPSTFAAPEIYPHHPRAPPLEKRAIAEKPSLSPRSAAKSCRQLGGVGSRLQLGVKGGRQQVFDMHPAIADRDALIQAYRLEESGPSS